MIAAVKDLASSASDVGPNQNAVDSLEACNPLFEQGMLSRRRINNNPSANKWKCNRVHLQSPEVCKRREFISTYLWSCTGETDKQDRLLYT